MSSNTPTPSPLHTGLTTWLTTVLKSLPDVLRTQATTMTLYPNLPELTTTVLNQDILIPSYFGLLCYNHSKFDQVGNITSKALIDVAKRVYEVIPKGLVAFPALQNDFLTALMFIVPQTALSYRSGAAGNTIESSPSIAIPIIVKPSSDQNSTPEQKEKVEKFQQQFDQLLTHKCPLIIVLRLAKNFVNFNVVVNPILDQASIPKYLIEIVISLMWDTVSLSSMNNIDSKAVKTALLRHIIKMGIDLYQQILADDVTKFPKTPENTKLLNILMESFNQAQFTTALASRSPSVLYPLGVPVYEIVPLTTTTMSDSESNNVTATTTTAEASAATTTTTPNPTTTSTKTPTKLPPVTTTSSSSSSNNTSVPAVNFTMNPVVRPLPIPTMMDSHLVFPNTMSHKKVNQAHPEEQEKAILFNYPLFTMAPLGHVTSCYTDKYGIPRQSSLVPHARAMINIRKDVFDDTLLNQSAQQAKANGKNNNNNNNNKNNGNQKGKNQQQSTTAASTPFKVLDGLDQYSHLWVHFIFHDAYTAILKENNHDLSLLHPHSTKAANKNVIQTSFIPHHNPPPAQSSSSSSETTATTTTTSSTTTNNTTTTTTPNTNITLDPSPCLNEPLFQPLIVPQGPREVPKEKESKLGPNGEPLPFVHNSGLIKKQQQREKEIATKNAQQEKQLTLAQLTQLAQDIPSTNQPDPFTPDLSIVRSLFISAPRSAIRPPKLQSSTTKHLAAKNNKQQNSFDDTTSSSSSSSTPTTCGFSSTRAPFRFNPIGQSLVRIESIDIDNNIIYISGHDLLNNTLILDIKPLHLSDLPLYQTTLFPSWVYNSYLKQFKPLVMGGNVINSPYGFTQEQLLINHQGANLMQLLVQRATTLQMTPNPVKPLVLGATSLLGPTSTTTTTTTMINTQKQQQEQQLVSLLKNMIPSDQFSTLISSSPLFASFIEKSSLSTDSTSTMTPTTTTTTKTTTTLSSDNQINHVLEQDGIPATTLCNEFSCVQFDPMVLLFIQYTLWCQYNIFYSKEKQSKKATDINQRLTVERENYKEYKAKMVAYNRQIRDEAELAMVPASIPASQPLPRHIPPRSINNKDSNNEMDNGNGDEEKSLEMTLTSTTTTMNDDDNNNTNDTQMVAEEEEDQEQKEKKPTPPPPTREPCQPFLPNSSLFSSLLPLIPEPTQSNTPDCPHIRDFNIAFTGETGTNINDPKTMYKSITTLFANHFRTNNFNTQSSYDHITSLTTSSSTSTSSTPESIDDYLQAEYHAILLTIIETLRCDPRSHHAISKGKGQGVFCFNLDNFVISFYIETEPMPSTKCNSTHHSTALQFDTHQELYNHLYTTTQSDTNNNTIIPPYQSGLNPSVKEQWAPQGSCDHNNNNDRLHIRIFHIQYTPNNPNIGHPYALPSRNRWLPSLYGFEWFLQQLIFASQFTPNPLIFQTIVTKVQYQLYHARGWYHNALFRTTSQPAPRTREWLNDLMEHYPEIQCDYANDQLTKQE